jgi:phosphatidylglycerol:prolipoprotein diacylglycerol transferase
MAFFSVTSLSPVCCNVFGIDIYWYGVAYVVSFWLALLYARFLAKKCFPDNTVAMDTFLPIACVGIILGGRLGHVIFFGFSYYSQHLLDIFRIRDGGMSFHGGLIGLILAAVWFCKKRKVPLIQFLDILSMVGPIGLGIGRIANFVNSELYGIPTTLPWGVLFRDVPEARHPTQIYEALTEGLLTFLVLHCVFRFYTKRHPGDLSVLFLTCYGTARFLVDFVKEADHHCGMTMGQWLSIVMIFAGLAYSVICRCNLRSS